MEGISFGNKEGHLPRLEKTLCTDTTCELLAIALDIFKSF